MKKQLKVSVLMLIFLLQTCILESQNLKLGQHYQGGIIFYLDESGVHGLMTAEHDQAVDTKWGRNGETGANSVSDGMSNTNKIVDYLGVNSNCAACFCKNLKDGGHNDWYLPSINELKMMHEKQFQIGNFVIGEYCSSTECATGEIWNVHFRPHRRVEFHHHKSKWFYNVRCIRKF